MDTSQIPQLHKLLLYVPIQDNLALVDTLLNDNKEELLLEAAGRRRQNPDYKAVLLTYELTGAQIIDEREQMSSNSTTEVVH